jgi:hypothetical protein
MTGCALGGCYGRPDDGLTLLLGDSEWRLAAAVAEVFVCWTGIPVRSKMTR